jgi:dipeptidyl aminopeptidase/acylaminoacyl peptidase
MRRRALLHLVAIGLLASACGADAGGSADPRPGPTSLVDAGPSIRTEERTIATLDTLVVRPSGEGPYPLVVFVHGAGAAPRFYEDLLRDLAAAGVVVVAPAMPGSVDDAGFGALAALPFQPGRVGDVIDAVTAGPQAIRAVDPDRVVVMGHSLGGMTALAVGFNSCCVDGRVDAVVSIAGQLASFPGSYSSGTVPLLLIHGEADDTVPFAGSGAALQQLGTSAYLLTVIDGDHGAYLGPTDAAYPAVVASIVAFVEATIGGVPQAGLADLTTAGSMPGVRLTTRG